MKKIKVVHILNSVGGVDVSLRLILENIDSSKFENYVIHGYGDTDRPYSNNRGEPVKDFKTSIQRNINVFKDFNAIYSTRKIVKTLNPDIIHAHSAKGGIIGKIVGKILGIPVLHTPQAYSFLSANSSVKRSLFLMIEKFFVKLNNKIVASSMSEMNRAINDVGYNPKNVMLFNNSINPIQNIEPTSINETWPEEYICSVGRPSYQKNIELMLDVIFHLKKAYPNIHLILMGVGYHSPNLKSIKNQIKTLNLENQVTLLEWTSRRDVFHIINNSKLYLTTARYEGLPYSVIESLALGKPIVATDADGNRDLVKHNHNGFLIYNNNVEELASAVKTLLVEDELRHKFSNNSLGLFSEKFNMNKNIIKLESIYRNES